MDNNLKRKKKQEGRRVAGLILTGVGAALLLRNAGLLTPYWLFSWPLLLIVIGLVSGIRHNFRNKTWIILMGTGGFFLLNSFIPGLRLAAYFWPAVIIALGIVFMVCPKKNSRMHCMDNEKNSITIV
jgi:Domain of unknown function (DUF5668)